MGIIGIVLAVVIVLVIIGLGPKAFWAGITTGYEKTIQIGGPILENITSEAEELASEESVESIKRVITN